MTRAMAVAGIWACCALSAGCFVDRSGIDPAASGDPRIACSVACENGGVCVGDQCFCGSIDYAGAACEERIDDCERVDCGEGTCVDGVRSHVCDCDENWALGSNGQCSVEVVSCATPNACVEGSCDDTSGSVACDYDPGFE
ncbi:MAG: hypothetical protein WBG86_13650 [Polyangiales bacterium]